MVPSRMAMKVAPFDQSIAGRQAFTALEMIAAECRI